MANVSIGGGGAEVNDLTAIVTWDDIPDGNVPESAVTQHEAAIDHDALTNFVSEEHRLVLQGTFASRPSFGTAGRYYHATDTGIMYYDTGSAWDTVGDGGAAEVNDLTAAVTWDDIPDANVPETAVTQHEAAIDHDALTNYEGGEHRLILQGVFASRPAFGTAGRYYHATDTGIFYYDTGSAWETVGDGGGVSGTLDATITGGTPDNDVNIPTASPVIFRSLASGDTPFTVSKAHTSTGVAALVALANTDLSKVASFGNLTTAGKWEIFSRDIRLVAVAGVNNRIGIASVTGAPGSLNIRGTSRADSGTGGDIFLTGGNADGASGNGGDASVRAGVSNGGVPGDVNLGTTQTDRVILGSSTNQVRVNNGLVFLERSALPTPAAAGFAQLWLKDDALQRLLFVNDAGDTCHLSDTGAYAFESTQIADAGTPVAGEFKTNNSSTPASITAINIHVTQEGDDFTAVLENQGPGSFVRIWKAEDENEWYTFRVTSESNIAASKYPLQVEHISDSGGTFDESGDWKFLFYSAAGVTSVSQSSHDITGASNWFTYSGSGVGDIAFTTDLASSNAATALGNLDHTFLGILAPVGSTIVRCRVGGYAVTSSATLQIRVVKMSGGTATDVSGASASLALTTSAYASAGIPLSTGTALAQGDRWGIMVRRASGSGDAKINVTYKMVTAG